MNPLLPDTYQVPYYVTELDADGNATKQPGDSVTVSTDDTNKATVAPDTDVDAAKLPAGTDPAMVLQTGFIVGGRQLGTVNVTATYSRGDGSTPPSPATLAIDIVPSAAVSGGFGIGTAVPQPAAAGV
jgi:hypothetical protein